MLIGKDLDALRIDRGDESERPRGRRGRIAAAIVLLIVVVGASLWLFGPGPAAAVRTTAVREETGSTGATVLNASGYVTARRRATVSAKVTGKLVESHVEEGLPVTAGQVLARLDDARFRAALRLAEAQLEASRRAVEETRARLRLAELTRDRVRRLTAEGVMGRADLDEAETEVEGLQARMALEREQARVAEREVDLRRTEIEDTVIRAPFTGIVISKDAQVGETVSPISAGGGFTRTGICTIVDMESLEIEVDVNEAYISRVRPGQRVEATLDAYPDWRIPAGVITTIPAADRQSATVLVRIGFDRLDARILPEMGVKVAFRESGSGEEPKPTRRMLVPRSALRRDGGKDVVFVYREGVAERRAVGKGAASGDLVEVTSGLSDGERVIVEGPEDLADGQRVSER